MICFISSYKKNILKSFPYSWLAPIQWEGCRTTGAFPSGTLARIGASATQAPSFPSSTTSYQHHQLPATSTGRHLPIYIVSGLCLRCVFVPDYFVSTFVLTFVRFLEVATMSEPNSCGRGVAVPRKIREEELSFLTQHYLDITYDIETPDQHDWANERLVYFLDDESLWSDAPRTPESECEALLYDDEISIIIRHYLELAIGDRYDIGTWFRAVRVFISARLKYFRKHFPDSPEWPDNECYNILLDNYIFDNESGDGDY